MKHLIVAVLLTLALPATSLADPDEHADELTSKEKLSNFAAVYVAQWAFYGASQAEIIRQHGSFQNMYVYPFQPRFDKDDFNYNVVKHTLAGNYYYLWYRSQGYEVKRAFVWTVISSLAFEFTVETMTERPSYQDMYQTPVFGSVVGIGAEKLSLQLMATDSKAKHFIAYVINPFLLLPHSHFRLAWVPPVGRDGAQVLLAGEF